MENDIEDCRSVWFAILDRSVNLCDYERAGEAVRELRRLGVEVKFHPPEETQKTEATS